MRDGYAALLVQTLAIQYSQSGDANYWLQAMQRQIEVNDLLESQRGHCGHIFLCLCMTQTGSKSTAAEEKKDIINATEPR